VENWKNITNSQNNSVRKKVLEEQSLFHIIGLDTGSLVLIVFDIRQQVEWLRHNHLVCIHLDHDGTC
jgi:hypothetical protein